MRRRVSLLVVGTGAARFVATPRRWRPRQGVGDPCRGFIGEVVMYLLANGEYKPPFPWFGGKSAVARKVWRRFGCVNNFVDPFCGSLAMLLLRPEPWDGTETVNDADGFISNFWRAVQWAPVEVAKWADWPVNENDLHARHVWLI